MLNEYKRMGQGDRFFLHKVLFMKKGMFIMGLRCWKGQIMRAP